ncbi:MAG: hypothetical protein M3463_08135 [Verrucomicrobiota bacterium]|nr:hypothetical protein [Verrucomicrobiota bacterium]
MDRGVDQLLLPAPAAQPRSGLGGKLKTGGHFLEYQKYQGRGHRTIAGLYLSLLEAAGKPRASFGLADIGLKDFDVKGPLAELLV